VFAAATDAEARRLFTSVQQQFLQLRRGEPGPVPPPLDSLESVYGPEELAGVAHALREAVVGSPETVRDGLQAYLDRTGADELMLTAQMYDHAARVRSFEIGAEVASDLRPHANASPTAAPARSTR
jgi:alkanesulfonate monooxygenase SsuD/methylene tetrahydromethanopterin reductase-like flavin-dependent oxidoreductase (luciferase family)